MTDENFERDGATGKRTRPHKIARGDYVAAQVREGEYDHTQLSDRGLDRLINDLSAAGLPKSWELEAAVAHGSVKGERLAPTKFQVETFQMIMDGMSTAEIAAKRGCKQASVSRVMERVIWNLGTHGQGQMARTVAMGMLVGAELVTARPLPEFAPGTKFGKKRKGQARKVAGPSSPTARASGVSTREWEVLVGASNGETSQETARRLGVSEETVKTQRKSVIARLGARNMMHAVGIAWARGVLS